MIRIGIFGYGNLGKGVECAIARNPDMSLAAVFTRRAPGAHSAPDPRRAGLSRGRAADHAEPD